MEVSFTGKDGVFQGNWDLTGVSRGLGKQGTFTTTRFANWLNVRITTKPLRNVEFQLTILKDKRGSMITGVIPLTGASFPFATITLFRKPISKLEMDGICPVDGFRPTPEILDR
jgi:hypothetical protein